MMRGNMNDKELTKFLDRIDAVAFLRNYKQLFKVFDECPAAAVLAFKKKGALTVRCGSFKISTKYNGEWSHQKSFENYETFMKLQVEKIVHDDNGILFKTELSQARNAICRAIYDEHSKVLPNWPTLFCTTSGRFELSTHGSYVVDNTWVLWQALGWIEVSETANLFNYEFSFSGNPEVKIAMIDLPQIQNLENLLSKDPEGGMEMLMESAESAGLIVRNWDFLKK